MSNQTPESSLEYVFAMWVLRLWLSVRAIGAGIEKFAGKKGSEAAVEIDGEPNDYGLTESASEKVYGFDHYHGVPEALYGKFQAEPLVPGFMLKIYDITLGPLLLIFGFMLLLGVCTRISLFAMGLIYTSLSFGLILLKQDAGVAWLATHIILVVMALVLAKHNRCVLVKNW